MNELKVVVNEAGIPTMSSLDMVDYINATRNEGDGVLSHDNFIKKVGKVLKEAARSFERPTPYTVNNATKLRNVYYFPEREATLLAMSYSYDLQAKVYDAWTAAKEALTKPSFELLDTSTHAKAKLAYLQTEMKLTEAALLLEDKTNELEAALPAVAFVETYVDYKGTHSLRDGFKSIAKKPTLFTEQLVKDGILYRNAKDDLCAKQAHITNGNFVHKPTEFGIQVRVTNKGLLFLGGKYN